MTTTAWYYEYYEPGSFPHQEILCETVVWTKYNLEGQIATETSLSPSAGNPLTIRLLAVRAALCQLTDYVGKLDSEIKAVTKNQLETKKFVGMRGTYYGKGSQANTGAAPMEVIKFDGEAKEFEIQHIIIQSALYGFFTNFGSVLDRLAFEIDLLYELNTKKIDWTKLVDTRPKYDKVWASLYKKDSQLADHVKNYRSKFKEAFYYRNKLVHDGLIDFEALFHGPDNANGFYIILKNSSNDIPDYKNNAFDLCTTINKDILQLMDESYRLMIEYNRNHESF